MNMKGYKSKLSVGLILILFIGVTFAGKKRIKLLTFRFLSKLDYVHGMTPVPKKLLKLEGKYVKIRGYIAPLGKTKGMDEFILIPVTLACCFLEAPPVSEQVWVNLDAPLKVDYTEKMITLKGTLHIEEKVKGKVLKSLTHIQADFVDLP